ncbi:MAG: hypothetical protein FWD64_10770, partial [Acidobacteriaceae bacterium]|nr:hypothetical protein [Acidobacteriaceae bacterium]
MHSQSVCRNGAGGCTGADSVYNYTVNWKGVRALNSSDSSVGAASYGYDDFNRLSSYGITPTAPPATVQTSPATTFTCTAVDPGQASTCTVDVSGLEQSSGGTYDTGTATLTINGVPITVDYGRTSSASGIASAFGELISGSCNVPATATASGSTLTFYKKGSDTITVSPVIVSDNPSLFAANSFQFLTSTTTPGGTAPAAENVNYAYDRYGNIALANISNNRVIGRQYDAAGNMVSDGNNSYTYDAEGNIIQASKMIAGVLVTSNYFYDALNRRVRVETATGAQEYVFNAAGQRVSVWNGS